MKLLFAKSPKQTKIKDNKKGLKMSDWWQIDSPEPGDGCGCMGFLSFVGGFLILGFMISLSLKSGNSDSDRTQPIKKEYVAHDTRVSSVDVKKSDIPNTEKSGNSDSDRTQPIKKEYVAHDTRVSSVDVKKSDIPNTEYITVNAKGIFVGGKPATTYRGAKIHKIDYVNRTFAWMQKKNPNIMEWHVMSSKTPGKFVRVGNPSSEHGSYAWTRVVLSDGTFGGWVIFGEHASATRCAYNCAYYCAYDVRASVAHRRAVLSTAVDKQTTVAPKQNANHKSSGRQIVVEKIAQKTK